MNNLLWIALGGGLGAMARYGLSGILPSTLIPYSIFGINISGSFLIGIVMTLAMEYGWLGERGRLFIAVGVLGGYTTFSTYMLGVHQLLTQGAPLAGIGYALGSLILGMAACWAGVIGTRILVQARLNAAGNTDVEEIDTTEGES
ncbi:fluoride efflux transporter CrcB [Sulfobacillus harzensis]|uniref:Fluoride-specific ion channel FluC n=1 Tax=Sulfobacillus harzensis TaxID=2729629 RepID=A0A7Y0Q2I0_9FIRM|nr:fluoride efflux transporter CrcB [Sulfobacillus harzensis]NMP21946.1 fluoride efflux transporter CrcB [Sulfobacillus harzensis]